MVKPASKQQQTRMTFWVQMPLLAQLSRHYPDLSGPSELLRHLIEADLRRKQARPLERLFGSIKSLESGVKLQKRVRSEWR